MSKFIIAIDGFDCNGKETITNLLEKKFISLGYKVSKKSFPNYDSKDFCIKFINGAFPNLPNNLVIESFLMHIASELNDKKENNTEDELEIEIFDRYWFCNLWYNCENKKELDNFSSTFKSLLDLLPKPDLSIIIKSRLEADLFFLKERKLAESKEYSDNDEYIYEDIYEDNIKGYIKRKNFFRNNFDTIFKIVAKFSIDSFQYNNFKPRTLVKDENGNYSLVSELIPLEEQANMIFKTAVRLINEKEGVE